MKWRVAITATLLNLLICAVLLFMGAYSSARLQNDLIEEELRVTCRLSAEMLDSAAFVKPRYSDRERKAYIRGIAEDGGMRAAYIADREDADLNEDGKWISSVLKILDMAAPEESFCIAGETNDSWLFNAATLSDGSIVVFSKASTGVMQMVVRYVYIMPIMFMCLALLFMIIEKYTGRSDRLVKKLMNVLEDFT